MRRIGVVLAVVMAGLAGCAHEGSSGPRYHTEMRRVTLHTEPEGARVYQLAQPGGGKVDLGMTPLVGQPVWVLTSFSMTFTDPAEGTRMAAEINSVRVRVEKEGYEPWEGLIAAPDAQAVAERTIVLEKKR